MNIIPIIEIEFKNVPGFGGLQLWNPRFRDMSKDELEAQTTGYSTFYNAAYFVRSTATIHLYNV